MLFVGSVTVTQAASSNGSVESEGDKLLKYFYCQHDHMVCLNAGNSLRYSIRYLIVRYCKEAKNKYVIELKFVCLIQAGWL